MHIRSCSQSYGPVKFAPVSVLTEIVRVIPEGTIGFGIQLPVQALSSLIAADWEHTAGVNELVSAAVAADRSGWSYVAVCDHVGIPTSRAEAMSTSWVNPVATLGFLAARTDRVNLLTNIYIAPLRPPLETAKAFATLDWLSGGRVILGVGAGHVAEEFEMLGVDFHHRGALLNQAIDEVKVAWSGEYASGIGQRPQPIRNPRPPIWVGGSTAPALRRVGERGDGWIPQGTPRSEMQASIDAIRSARDAVRPGVGDPEFGWITWYAWIGDDVWDFPGYTKSGSAEQIAEQLQPLVDVGVTHFQVRLRARSSSELNEQIERWGNEVAPLVSATVS